jgi:hypothetical protein
MKSEISPREDDWAPGALKEKSTEKAAAINGSRSANKDVFFIASNKMNRIPPELR